MPSFGLERTELGRVIYVGHHIAMPRGSPMNGPEARADIQEDVHPVYSMLGDCKATRQLGVEES